MAWSDVRTIMILVPRTREYTGLEVSSRDDG